MKPESDLSPVTLAERLNATNGRPSGFDYLRLGLAISVVIVHTVRTTYGVDSELWTTALRPFVRAIIPMFFALSGFLVAGSLERSKTTLTFIGLRLIRIYPALAVEVALSAFLIGMAVTAFPLATYFQDPLAPFSAAFSVWLSMTAAVGLASRPSCSRKVHVQRFPDGLPHTVLLELAEDVADR